MRIEKWTGMVESSAEAGCIWYHATIPIPNEPWRNNGMLFEAPPDADEETLLRIAGEKWRETEAKKMTARVS